MTAVALGAGGAAALAVLLAAAPHRPRAPRWPHPAAPARPPDARPSRPRLRRAVVVGAIAIGALVVAPPLAPLVLAGDALRARHTEARARRRTEHAAVTALPDVVDLLLLGTSAGLALPIAHPLVATRVPDPLGAALRAAAVRSGAGEARADAVLDALAPLGDGARRLADVLADHLRYGLPLAPGLERLGAELRLDRRRRAEQAARRVPVQLLGPLVTCILPAFALLTVVPLLGASLRALPS